MKRTTVTLEERLFRALKKKSAQEGRTLQAVINDLLGQALATIARPTYELRLQGWKTTELPRVDLLNRDALFDLMNGG